MKKCILLKKITLCLLLLMGTSSCQSKHRGEHQQITINLGDDPQSLDPRLARDPASQMLTRMFFEGLTRIGPDDQPQMALATQVEISEDLTTYLFTLRKASWSNGDPVTADDFVYSWQSLLDPSFPSDLAFQLFMIKNGKEVKEGILPKEALGVKALRTDLLQVELTHPIPYALEIFASSCFYPVHPATAQKQNLWATKPQTYVCNGPFLLDQWHHNDLIVGKKNPNYWDVETVSLDEIDCLMVTPEVELTLFEKKQIHWCGSPLSTLPLDALESLQKKEWLKSMPTAQTSFIRVNTLHPLLRHKKVRHALAFAVDRNSIVEHVTKGGQKPALRLTPLSMNPKEIHVLEDGRTRKAHLLWDEVTKEKELEHQKLPPVKLTYIQSERGHRIAQCLQQQWADALGLAIILEPLERKVYFSRIGQQDYDLAFSSWGADYNDPISFLEVFKYQTKSTNNTHWEDPHYTEMLTASALVGDRSARLELLHQCEELLIRAMPIIPIFYYSLNYCKDEKIDGVFVSSLGNLDFKWASLQNGN